MPTYSMMPCHTVATTFRRMVVRCFCWSLNICIARSLVSCTTLPRMVIWGTVAPTIERHRFSWPSLYRYLRRYVNACDPCKGRKRHPTAPAGLFSCLMCQPNIFFHIKMNLLSVSYLHMRKKWLCVAIDYTTISLLLVQRPPVAPRW